MDVGQMLGQFQDGGPSGGRGLLGLLSAVLSGSAVLVAIVFVAALWWFKPTRKIMMQAIRAALACVLVVIGLFAWLTWKPVSWIADKFMHLFPLDRFAAAVLDPGRGRAVGPLVGGDRRKAAELAWDPVTFPDLYVDVPEDVARPPYEDGRLLGGVAVVWLADRHMTNAAYQSAVRGGFKAGLVVFVLIAVLLLIGVFLNVLGFIPALFDGQRPILEQWPGDKPVQISALSVFAANFGAETFNLAGKLVAFALYLAAAIPLSIGAGIIIMFLLLTAWMGIKAEPYRLVTKDADVRWPYRSETRALLRQTFRKQVEQATGYLKQAATYAVATATGTLRARGDLTAPTPGQPIKLDRESLFQHLLVFGGTGEGKTTALLKPLLRQVLSDRAFGAFVADAKGVLWHDAEKVAEACGRAEDVIVIGTGPDQHGINPIASLSPTQVAATLRSVMRQMSGEAADNFWPEMAANIVRHALTIGQAYGRTAAGQAEMAATKVNPYSLWWAYRAIIITGSNDHPGPMTAAIRHLRADYLAKAAAVEAADDAKAFDKSRELAAAMAMIHGSETYASLDYIEGAWATMAKETRTGVIASVTQILDGFSGAPVLRERFASGLDAGMVDLRQALDGKIILNALSSIEDGLPARLTSILIKTALYREARVREAEWKRQGLGSPQNRPCLVMMDEVQELATVDPASGLSDASFWNVARSTGLAGVFATQTLAALNQAMGRDATENFVQQARSKVFLRSEDRETVEYACWCAGEYERNRVYDDGHRESIEYRGLIDGWDPLAPIDEEEHISAGPHAFFEAAKGLVFPDRLSVSAASARPTYAHDMRFIATDPTPGEGGGSGGDAARMGSLQASAWRAEDLTQKYRMEGNTREAALTPADIMHMGRWHAFAQIQRAGAVRQDIVRVEHEFG